MFLFVFGFGFGGCSSRSNHLTNVLGGVGSSCMLITCLIRLLAAVGGRVVVHLCLCRTENTRGQYVSPPPKLLQFFPRGAPLTIPWRPKISAVNRLKKFDWVSLSVVPFLTAQTQATAGAPARIWTTKWSCACCQVGLRLPCQSARSIASANISANTLSISAVEEEEEEEEEEDLLLEEPIGRRKDKGKRHNSVYDTPLCFNFFTSPPPPQPPTYLLEIPGHLTP